MDIATHKPKNRNSRKSKRFRKPMIHTHPELAAQLVDPSLAESITAGSSQKVEWVCSVCDHRWMTSPTKRRTGGKHGIGTNCPQCHGIRFETTKDKLLSRVEFISDKATRSDTRFERMVEAGLLGDVALARLAGDYVFNKIDLAEFKAQIESDAISRTRNSNITSSVRREVIARDEAICQNPHCNASLVDNEIHIDHIVPVSHGGPNISENMQVLCIACNLRKSDTAWPIFLASERKRLKD